MKYQLIAALVLLSINTGWGQSSDNGKLSNDEYDRIYMAKKDFRIYENTNDNIIDSIDINNITNMNVKVGAVSFLNRWGGRVTLDEHLKNYTAPVSKMDAILHKNLQYKEIDGKRLMMDIYLPKNTSKKTPLVMFIHGGGWFNGDKYIILNKKMNIIATRLLEKGIAVASINYRLIDNPNLHVEDCVIDAKDALAYINKESKKYNIDTKKIGVWGTSAGGHMTLMLGFTENNDFKGDKKLSKYRTKPAAVVSWFGPGDFTVKESANLEESKKALKQQHLRFTSSTDWETRCRKAKEISPITYIDPKDPPALVMNGDKDGLVNVQQAYTTHKVLDQNNVENKMVIVKNADHNWSGENIQPTFEGICDITIDFLVSKLLNK